MGCRYLKQRKRSTTAVVTSFSPKKEHPIFFVFSYYSPLFPIDLMEVLSKRALIKKKDCFLALRLLAEGEKRGDCRLKVGLSSNVW